MNILSVFDGMSCGQIALNRAGIHYDKYFASEIDKYAIKVTQENYPSTTQLGCITEVKADDLPIIDLLIGGSPCQGFSFAGKQLNFDDPRSKLFFEYVRLLKELNPRYFLLENVKMKKEFQDVISACLGVLPIEINSSLVSAQNRKRLYWTNIPNVSPPQDKGILLKDIIEEGGFIDRDKAHCIDANYFKGGNLKSYFEKHRRQLVFSKDMLCHVGDADIKGNDSIKRVYHVEGKCPTLTTMGGGHREPKILVSKIREKSKCVRSSGRGSYDKHEWDSVDELHYRKLTPLECERLQTVPDNYTKIVSNNQRYKMLGNGWTVDIVAHIFKELNNGMVTCAEGLSVYEKITKRKKTNGVRMR
jgi:DNA-cytosine methyltransferase